MIYYHLKILLLITILHLSIAQEEASEKKIVCYYTDWSVYRKDSAMFKPIDINPNICTHLIYAFAKFSDEGGIAPFDEWQDITKKGYIEFNQIKKLNEEITTLLAIGGWSEGSTRFSRIASIPDRRLQFADSVAKFLRLHDFDGINLDWQFPSFRDGSREEDINNYVELIKDLRMTFQNETIKSNRKRLLVTLSVPSAEEYIEKGFDLINLQKYADFINILGYDYHLSYDPFVNHHSPLYPLPGETGDHANAKLNVDSTIKYLLEKGMRKEIINLGIPTFGRTFTLEDPNENGLGAPAQGQGQEGKATREKGYKAYYEVCKDIKNDNWTVVNLNSSALGPYAYKGENWVGYDDENIVRKKAEYARDMGLGGIMFWTIDDDDFRGECSSRGNPLIRAGREALLAKPARGPVPATPTPTVMPREMVTTVTMQPSPQPPRPVVTPDVVVVPPVPAAPPVNIPLPPPIPINNQPVLNVPNGKNPVQPIKVSTQKDDGKNTYYQEITVWVINNIFNFNL